MKLDYLKEKNELVSVALLGVSIFLGLLMLIKISSYFTVSARAKNLARNAVMQSDTDTQTTEKYLSESREIATKLKAGSLFSPAEPKQHPVKEVRAIFGDEVLIEDKWYKVGQTVGEAKILAIEPTKVRIEWDGSEKTFLPIDASLPEPSKSDRAVAQGDSNERPDMVVVNSDTSSMQGPGGRRGAGGFMQQGGPGGRGVMGGGFGQMRQGFQNMSDAERQRFREEMRSNFGGGPGGDFFGGRGQRGGQGDDFGGQGEQRGGRSRGQGGGRGGQ